MIKEIEAKLVPIIRRALQEVNAEAKEFDEGNVFRVVMTDETLDRYQEVLRADGMDFANFMKNPVILANHDYTIESIIGKATNIYYDQERRQWICEGVWSKTNPLAQLAKQLYDEGMLKAVSVGLIPFKYSGNQVVQWELLELSFVAVPANPNALSLDEKTLQLGLKFGLLKSLEENNEVCECCKQTQELMKNLAEDIASVKSFIADGKAKEAEADYEAKETLQSIARLTSEALRSLKSR